jgi:hypothetical protein
MTQDGDKSSNCGWMGGKEGRTSSASVGKRRRTASWLVLAKYSASISSDAVKTDVKLLNRYVSRGDFERSVTAMSVDTASKTNTILVLYSFHEIIQE